ncbi:MAG: exodeoxyribonuclease VII large subunit [Alphaproteobacteria bacterium]|nr:exodeoxyribonuclease VII large subunit [Alphaproteobacteria bacterium]
MTDTPRSNLPELTVSELSGAIKRTLESGFERVRVRGELSGFKRHTSGHLYFALKDADALIDGVVWRGQAARLAIKPEDGLEVICTGRVTTYGARSKYQLIVDQMEMAGEGALLKMIEERRKRLAAEGLFDESRKQKLPFLPEVIGVVTSPTGAVIRDILHRLADRFPRRVLVWPVAVQGEGAALQVAEAIRGFNALEPGGAVPRPDVLIVARGGGSLEDLMAFNEEIVVRAAAASAIPLISAVGHETDTTLIDFAASRRAPTPTAAAEMAVPVRSELVARISRDGASLVSALTRLVDERRARVEGLGRGLGDPRRLVEEQAQRLDDRAERLGLALRRLVERRQAAVAEAFARLPHPRQQLARAQDRLQGLATRLITARDAQQRQARQQRERLAELADRAAQQLRRRVRDDAAALNAQAALLESFSYARVLERGFALVSDAKGKPVTTRAGAVAAGEVSLRFHDGAIEATVAGDGMADPGKPRKRGRAGQGSLL